MSLTTDSGRRRWAALALIVTAQFMVILDVAIVNVALPSIKTDLDFSQASLQWVVSAYAIFFGGALLLGGRLADLLGRRRLFVGGLAALRGELAALRDRLVGGIADRIPRPPGARRCAACACGAVAPHDHLRRRARAQPRARHLRRGLRQWRRRRRPARRCPDQLSELVVDLLRQRPGRHRGRRCSHRCCCGESRPELGHRHLDARGAVTATGRADAARLRADARHD